jgi:hypothetical protein
MHSKQLHLQWPQQLALLANQNVSVSASIRLPCMLLQRRNTCRILLLQYTFTTGQAGFLGATSTIHQLTSARSQAAAGLSPNFLLLLSLLAASVSTSPAACLPAAAGCAAADASFPSLLLLLPPAAALAGGFCFGTGA